MIFVLRRINLISLLCSLAFISCLSMGLFYYFATKMGNVIDRSYRLGEISGNPECMFSVAVWTENICRKTFDNLAWFPKFPNFPEQRYCEKNFSSFVRIRIYNTAVIKRILVSFSSLEPGFYQFRTMSSLPLKIYLENGQQSSNRDLVLVSNGSTNFLTVFSQSVFLSKNSFLEIITYCPPGDNLLSLDWLVPGSARFVPIHSRDLLPVGHVTAPQNSLGRVLPPDKSTLVGFIPRRHVMKGFHVCSLHDIQVWRDIHNTQNISVYTASSPLDAFINEVLKLIMASLQKAAPSKYPAYKINKLELSQNTIRAELSRLLVDLNLTVDGLDYIERFSEYLFVYYHDNQLDFCRPLCYQWDRAVPLSFVFLTDCSRNDQPWGLYFIENTIELLQRSLEVKFRVIITACDEEQHRSYESRLRDTDIDRNMVVLLEAMYKRTRAMKAALSFVETDSIVVLCESGVKMPAGISEEIRKHTFKTLMAYSPIPFQLDCGYFPEGAQLKGHWCPECDAVTAMYKEDWEQILSSYNENEDIIRNKTELPSLIKKSGIEIAQVKLKDLYRL